jgi:6-bladed beta-propeller
MSLNGPRPSRGERSTASEGGGNLRRPSCRRSGLVLTLLPFSAGWWLACSDPGGTGVPSSSTRDSGAVKIVESAAPAWRGKALWTISGEPSLQIGVQDGDPVYSLSGVAGTTRLSDGRIAVLNAGSGEIRIFDPHGRHLHSTGGIGQGPGEFLQPQHLRRVEGDSLLVWDAGIRSYSVFDATGSYARSERMLPIDIMEIIGFGNASESLIPLPDRSFVLRVTQRSNAETREPGVLYRPPIGFFRVRRGFSAVDSLGWYDGVAQVMVNVGGRQIKTPPLFTTVARVEAGGTPWKIYVGLGDPYEVRVFDKNAVLTTVIRRTDPPLTIPRSQLKAARQRRLRQAEAAGQGPQMQRILAALPPQEHYPAHGRILPDSEGCLWVRRPQGWDVLMPRVFGWGPLTSKGSTQEKLGKTTSWG